MLIQEGLEAALAVVPTRAIFLSDREICHPCALIHKWRPRRLNLTEGPVTSPG